MDFNLEHLKSFIVVARIGNLSAAARKLGTTQPNLGRQMTALEKEVRFILFSRHSRGMHLTKQGQDFLQVCEDIVGQLTQKTDVIREKESEPEGILNVVTGIGTSQEIINNIYKFIKKFPKLQLNLISHVNILDVKPVQFKVGDTDLAILPVTFADPDIVNNHLFDNNLRIYAAPSYIREHSIPKTLEELKLHRIIVYAGNSKEIPESLNLHLPSNISLDTYSQPLIAVNNGINLRSALLNGLGIGTYYYDAELIKNNLLVDIFPDMPSYKVPYYLSYHKRLKDSPRLQAFQRILKEMVKTWHHLDED